MLCDICKKNEATIHIEEISSSGSRMIHVCSECMLKNPQFGALEVGNLNLAGIVYNLAEKIQTQIHDQTTEVGGSSKFPNCPNCNWSHEALRQSGKLGCPHCYTHFGGILGAVISGMHRSVEHTGKRPGNFSLSQIDEHKIKLTTLRKALEVAVRNEEYEKAAKLRDEINILVSETKGPGTP